MEDSQAETEAVRTGETRKDELGREIMYPKLHKKTVKGQWKFRCKKKGCGRLLYTKHLLKLHMAKHNKKETIGEAQDDNVQVVPLACKKKPRIFFCIFCSKGFCRKDHLEAHIRSHINERPFSCPRPNCEKTFKTVYSVRGHLLLHSNKRPHKCSKCEESFKTVATLSMHMKHIHLTENHKHACHSCDATFVRREQLKNHLQTHMDPHSRSSFECPECEEIFTKKNNLQRHMNRCHNKEKPLYKCSYCGKTFPSKEDLQEHKQTHVTREKQFSCAICDTNYTVVGNLNKHLKSSGHIKREMDYKKVKKSAKVQQLLAKKNFVLVASICCKSCASTFASEQELTLHDNKVHNLEVEIRPFCCEVEGCDKAYKQKRELKTHVECVHWNLRHVCARCGNKYKQIQSLRIHNRRHPDCGNVTKNKHSDTEHPGDKIKRTRKINNKNQSVDPKNKSAPKRPKLKGKALLKARISARLQNKKASN